MTPLREVWLKGGFAGELGNCRSLGSIRFADSGRDDNFYFYPTIYEDLLLNGKTRSGLRVLRELWWCDCGRG
jgi:hypothetical protein